MKNDRYAYRVTWSEEDDCYVGICLEFPSLSWLDASPEDALKGVHKLVLDVIRDMDNSGESIPKPISGKKYSGKFIVRVPPDVHRRLTLEAADSNVSLNRLVSAKLSS